MDVRQFGTIMLAIFLLCGCSLSRVYRGPYPAWPWDTRTSVRAGETSRSGTRQSPVPLCSTATCGETDAIYAWNEASAFCMLQHQDYGKAGSHDTAAKSIVKALGIVSGTVMQNITTGSAAKAWGSVAGGTNAYGDHLNGVLIKAVTVNQRVAIEKAVEEWEGKYIKALQDPKASAEVRVWLAISMARECSMGAARAEQEVLNALSKVGTEPDTGEKSNADMGLSVGSDRAKPPGQ